MACHTNEARCALISPDHLESAMARWKGYVNLNDVLALVKISVAHAEFESIRPFRDGNGRIGRILVPPMLCGSGIITSPCFYLSEFFEHRNAEYQDRLLAGVR